MTTTTGIGDDPKSKRRRLLQRLRRAWMMTGLALWGVFLIFQYFACRASGPARAALQSDAAVRVTMGAKQWRFEPVSRTHKSVGLIFFPGSLVEPAAYAPLARTAANQGYPVTIVLLPLRFAPLASHKTAVLREASRIVAGERAAPGRPKRWVIAGHSLGGKIAARFAREYPDHTDGLILIGTSHPRDFDLSGATFAVTKIYGSRDGLASPGEVRQYAVNLPKRTHWVEITGGNHAQMGWYGYQIGDHSATIGHAEQQDRLATAVLEAMGRAEETPTRRK